MKKFLIHAAVIILSVILCGCGTGNTSSVSSPSSKESVNEIADNTVSIEDALYIVQAEYGDTQLDEGQKSVFDYRRNETVNTIEYYVFGWTVTDADGNSVRVNPEIWVASDGSHTTTEAVLNAVDDPHGNSEEYVEDGQYYIEADEDTSKSNDESEPVAAEHSDSAGSSDSEPAGGD